MINDFIKTNDMPEEIIKKYSSMIPAEIEDIWKDYGIGSFLYGYLRIINPDEYLTLIKDTYFRGDVSVPLFITAFGDIITWGKNEYVGIVNYKNGTFDIIIKSMKNFSRCLEENYFINKFFEISLYNEAINLMGDLDIDECFGYVPLLGLGGNKNLENLKKVKTREHIELISRVVGNIGM